MGGWEEDKKYVLLGCNAGRSVIILPLPLSSTAAHSQREVHGLGTNLLK